MTEPERERERGPRFTVGYALAPKKQNSFIRDSLVNLARSRGIDLVKIDTTRPLADQGPFHCVLHKLYGQEWKEQLGEFRLRNPNAVIIDSPDAIERLHNRISMLQVVSELEIESRSLTFGIPKQIVIYDKETLFDQQSWVALKFPVISKPLVADGSAKSHKMALVYNHDGLNKLKPPIVLQEFVNHGGVIFKVYVVGSHVQCVKRKSLPDVSASSSSTSGDAAVLPFSQVSNIATDEKAEEKYYEMMDLDDTKMPPQEFIEGIANGLRGALKLNLFNFDVIRDARFAERYFIIDINYFPGYAKMPSYETVLTDFFWDLLNNSSELNSFESFDKEVSNTCCGDGDRKREREDKENSIHV